MNIEKDYFLNFDHLEFWSLFGYGHLEFGDCLYLAPLGLFGDSSLNH